MKLNVEAKQKGLIAFKQILMEANADGIQCEVYLGIGTTNIEIIVNGKPYVVDLSELANDLIRKVVQNGKSN